MPGYLSAIGREFDTTASKWFGVIEGAVTLGGYGVTAWFWWHGAAAWQTAIVGALSTCVLVLIVYSAGRAAWTTEHRKRIEAEGAWKATMRSHALGVEWDKAIAVLGGRSKPATDGHVKTGHHA